MANYAIEISNLGKQYKLGQREPYVALRDILSNPFTKRPPKEEFWALKDVNLKVKEGEVLGVIGKNGSGKSTLLKILTRITPPTTGKVKLHGRVASLLEVGTGFNPELTGRENIFLNGSILGMSRSEIRRKFDEIVDFSGVGKFIDTPVKRYSSGMYVRLAFAVAAHLESEILLVDEVLAVGDAEFQKKCLTKMQGMTKTGRTVLFVSHHLDSISKICNTAIELKNGQILQHGNSRQVIDTYLNNQNKYENTIDIGLEGPLSEFMKIIKVKVNDLEDFTVSPSDDIIINFHIYIKKIISNFKTTMSVYRDETRIFSLHDVSTPKSISEGKYKVGFIIPKYFLRPGTYTVGIGGFDEKNDWAYCKNAFNFTIKEKWHIDYIEENVGLVNLNLKTWREFL